MSEAEPTPVRASWDDLDDETRRSGAYPRKPLTDADDTARHAPLTFSAPVRHLRRGGGLLVLDDRGARDGVEVLVAESSGPYDFGRQVLAFVAARSATNDDAARRLCARAGKFARPRAGLVPLLDLWGTDEEVVALFEHRPGTTLAELLRRARGVTGIPLPVRLELARRAIATWSDAGASADELDFAPDVLTLSWTGEVRLAPYAPYGSAARGDGPHGGLAGAVATAKELLGAPTFDRLASAAGDVRLLLEGLERAAPPSRADYAIALHARVDAALAGLDADAAIVHALAQLFAGEVATDALLAPRGPAPRPPRAAWSPGLTAPTYQLRRPRKGFVLRTLVGAAAVLGVGALSGVVTTRVRERFEAPAARAHREPLRATAAPPARTPPARLAAPASPEPPEAAASPDARAAPPPPKEATLRVVRPRGWRVWVDGALVGEAPLEAAIACGVRRLRVGSAGTPRDVEVPCGGKLVVE